MTHDTGEPNYGIVLPNWEVDGETERLVDYAMAAEDAGWDGGLPR